MHRWLFTCVVLGWNIARGIHEESSVESFSSPIEGSSSPPTAEVFSIPDSFKEGLAKTYWPGRTQRVERANLTFYIDGAHTKHSIEACCSWFWDKSNEEIIRKRPKRMCRVLIFNFKGNRDARTLMEPLVKCNFDYVVFCPNLLSEEPLAMTSDISNFSIIPECEKQKCYKNQETWKEIIRGHNLSADSLAMPKIQTLEQNSRVFGCITDAVHWVVNDRDASITSRKATLPDVISRADHVQILVTGSLFLVGMVMKVLGPDVVEM